ncbi:hypothetical protein QVD17_20998 [Tagetes erecta]|uniref:Uncharacterized protein n=1 Tax=Tagetes erecta TaxID=13708 RepID=A0AAD8NXR0_TARER|nr:hypothetical protein QVD17_20998 [Tagetes erecta]
MESLDGDDTVVYEEITRRILMLMEDDNETHGKGSYVKGGAKSGGGLVVARDYFSWSEIGGRRCEVPAWMERLWASNVAGTGVFIPRVEAASSKYNRRKRRNKSRKNKVNDGGRVYSSGGHMIHG